jgi:hypothetical protein
MLGKLLGAVALVAMTLVPSVLAVHGEPYDAYGTAVGANGSVLLARVSWSGWWDQTFTVTLKDPATSAVVTNEVFRGVYQISGGWGYGGWEFLPYQAWAQDGQSHFYITGGQAQAVTNGGPNKAVMLYVGNYWDYQLQLVVPYTFPIPW